MSVKTELQPIEESIITYSHREINNWPDTPILATAEITRDLETNQIENIEIKSLKTVAGENILRFIKEIGALELVEGIFES